MTKLPLKILAYRQLWSRDREAYSKNQKRLLNLYYKEEGICYLCDGKVPHPTDFVNINNSNMPTIEHITPKCLGGRDILENIKLAHSFCNSLKGIKYPSKSLKKIIRKKAMGRIKNKNFQLTFYEKLEKKLRKYYTKFKTFYKGKNVHSFRR